MLFDRCYPKITDWLFDVSNQAIDLRVLPLYSYGFWVAMGFLVAAIILGKELKRREALGLFQYTEKEVHEGAIDYFSFMVAAVVGYLVGSKGAGYMGLSINDTIAAL
jgi:prolipoprotein diacylglyceryltransferase